MLAGRAFGVRITLDDYDQRAPSVTFRDAWDWTLLKFPEMARGSNIDSTGKVSAVVLDVHPMTGLPFLCMRGIREYHEHPQHTGDDWMLYRGAHGVFSVVATIFRTCVQLAQPNVFFFPGNIQVVWEADEKRRR